MAGPLFPDVPQALGVPPVRRGAENSGQTTEIRRTKDDSSINQAALGQWGIYRQSGGLAVAADNVVALGFSGEYRLADYPIERGGFESYDKVALPFDIRIAMSKGGKLDDRRSFLTALEAIRGDRKLYDVVTPERVYTGVNIERVVVDRGQGAGAGMVTAEIHLREIRESATVAFSASRDPASADSANSGSVQTRPVNADAAGIQ